MPRRKRQLSLLEKWDKEFERKNKRFEQQLKKDSRRARLEEKRRKARQRKEAVEARKDWAIAERQAKQRAIAQREQQEKQRIETIKIAKRKHLENVQFKLQDLSPDDFEEFVAIIFERMGYETTVRGGTGDEGVDVEARRENEFLVIQCKKYGANNKVGSPDIQRFYGAIKANRANKGIFVTTSLFTEPAKKYASRKAIDLVDYEQLDQWAKTYRVGPYAKIYQKNEEIIVTQDNSTPTPTSDNFSEQKIYIVSNGPTIPKSEAYITSRKVARSSRKLNIWQSLILFLLATIALFVCGCAALAGLGAIVGSGAG